MAEEILLSLIVILLGVLLTFVIRGFYSLGRLEGRLEERDKRLDERFAYINEELKKIWQEIREVRILMRK